MIKFLDFPPLTKTKKHKNYSEQSGGVRLVNEHRKCVFIIKWHLLAGSPGRTARSGLAMHIRQWRPWIKSLDLQYYCSRLPCSVEIEKETPLREL